MQENIFKREKSYLEAHGLFGDNHVSCNIREGDVITQYKTEVSTYGKEILDNIQTAITKSKNGYHGSYRCALLDIINVIAKANDTSDFLREASRDFFEDLYSELDIDVESTLKNINEYIDAKDKEHWEVWGYHEQPTTVAEIRRTTGENNNSLSSAQKLSKALALGAAAAEENDRLWTTRSDTTKTFYSNMVSLVKFDDPTIELTF